MKKTNRFIALLTALVLVFSTMISSVAFAAVNTDVAGTDFEVAVGKLKAVGIMEGYPDGTFLPAGEITRAEFAKIAVLAYGLGNAAEASKGTTKFTDVAATNWAAGYINLAANKGLINGYPGGTFKPEGKITNAEAITILCRLVGLGPVIDKSGTWPANYVGRAANEGILKGVNVASTTNATRGLVAKMLVNTLTVDVWGATGYEDDGSVNYGKTGETLLADKLNITEYNNDVEDAAGNDLYDEVRVTAIDTDKKTITLDENGLVAGTIGTFDIAEGTDVDAYQAYLNEVNAWVNEDDEVVYVEIQSDFYIDAIEIDGTDLTVVTADKTLDYVLANVETFENDAAGALGDTNYPLAKVVLDGSGDVAYVDAYTMTDFAVVESVSGNEVTTVDGTEVNFKDYRIFKDGKLAAVKDMVKGDIVTFDTVASGDIDGFADIYTKSVTGPIDKAYTELFKVKGVEYDYNKGLTTDGTTGVDALYLDGSDLESMDIDSADQFKTEGDVTVFVDRAGEALYVTGKLGAVATSDMGGILTTDTSYDVSFGDNALKFTYVNQESKKVTKTVGLKDLDKITIDGTAYEVGEPEPVTGLGADIDYFELDAALEITPYDENDNPLGAGVSLGDVEEVDDEIIADTDDDVDTWLDANSMVTFTYDENGAIVELEFFNANTAAVPAADIDIEDDDYVGGKQIQSSTLLFDITDGVDAGDTVITKWSDIKTVEKVTAGTVYFNDDSEVVYVVATGTDAAADKTYIALIEDHLTNSDGTTEITAWVDGVSKTFEVDELAAPTDGEVYQLTVNSTDLVTKMLLVDGTEDIDDDGNAPADADDLLLNNDLTIALKANVNTADKTITIGGTTYKLATGAKVINRLNGEDIEVISLLELQTEITEAANRVTFILSTADVDGYRHVQMVIVTDDTALVDLY